MVQVRHEMARTGGRVVLRGVGPRLRQLLTMTGLDHDFTLE